MQVCQLGDTSRTILILKSTISIYSFSCLSLLFVRIKTSLAKHLFIAPTFSQAVSNASFALLLLIRAVLLILQAVKNFSAETIWETAEKVFTVS